MTYEQLFDKYYHIVHKLAHSLIPKIDCKPNEKILDFACRNGKITALLANHFPDCDITAITTSSEFLSFIEKDVMLKNLPQVHFDYKETQELNFKNEFDKITSFSGLTWIQDKVAALEKLFLALKPGGKAYLQFFVDHGQTWFNTCILRTAEKKEWKDYFTNFKHRVIHMKPGAFLYAAENCGFALEFSELSKRKIPLPSEQYFKNWLLSWSSHRPFLPEDKWDSFFSQTIEYYLNTHPKDTSGQIYYEDFHFDVVLLKPEK